MRIVGELPHPVMKITVFKNDGKFSIKFESGLVEQIYKFREDERLQTFEDIQKLADEVFIEKTADLLRGMYATRDDAFQRNFVEEEDEFDVIL
jgi:esterase/lipase superfamily enzyme